MDMKELQKRIDSALYMMEEHCSNEPEEERQHCNICILNKVKAILIGKQEEKPELSIVKN